MPSAAACYLATPSIASATSPNDSDLKQPVAVAHSELRISVGIINPHPAARRSRAFQSTFFKQIRVKDLAVCQLPAVLHDARGRTHKPPAW
jgi:hypothetical protein